jgi:hypothetical protein
MQSTQLTLAQDNMADSSIRNVRLSSYRGPLTAKKLVMLNFTPIDKGSGLVYEEFPLWLGTHAALLELSKTCCENYFK